MNRPPGPAEPLLRVRRIPGCEDVPLPCYQTEGSAGLDLRAAVPGDHEIQPGEIARVPTGIQIALPPGYEGQVRPRSGLAERHGLSIPNAPGTIDSDYRGELAVLLVNLGREPVRIRRGDRIAQLVVAPVARVRVQEVADLDDTARGAGGFGHTGG